VSKHLSPLQCPEVDNDEDVVTSDEFNIPLDPAGSHSKSYGTTIKNEHISRLKIINEKYIPSTIFGLKNLEHLEIRNTCFFPCKYSTIPSNIQCLASSLTELGIYDTNITHLPNEIIKLVRLKTLKLSNTGLMFLPNAIGNLKSLISLYLPKNNLKYLPMTIRNLRSLQELILSNNPYLHSIEPVNGLLSLIFLDTRHCPIDILPRNLPKLTTLYMSNNTLTNLNGIGTLGTGIHNPKFFYLDMNYIQSVPPGIREIKNLRWLKLDQNNLKNLPTNIFNITTLFHLDIQHNQFHPQNLKEFVSKFRQTNPNLEFLYKNQTQSN
jgi:Leucine-rich repeat (LRR) protein